MKNTFSRHNSTNVTASNGFMCVEPANQKVAENHDS